MTKILQIYTNSPLKNFSYLIEGPNGVFCIDPFDSLQIKELLQGRKLLGIINTHEHFDHYCGNAGLQNLHPKVYAHKALSGLIPGFSDELSEGSQIEISKNSYLEIVETPGHCPYHLALLYIEDSSVKAVFSGDTLFNAGVGNCKNGGDPSVLFDSIWNYYAKLDDEVLIYPGHDYLENNLKFTLSVEKGNINAQNMLKSLPDSTSGDFQTNIGIEKKINTFLRLDKKSIIDVTAKKTEKERFIELRKMRDSW